MAIKERTRTFRNLRPQFFTDTTGGSMVILSSDNYNSMMEFIENAEDVLLYDAAKKEDDGYCVDFDAYLKKRNLQNA
jgi:hypothetical protein